MRKVTRKSRQTEVARTGRIPVGTDVHHHHLRNPSIGYLVRDHTRNGGADFVWRVPSRLGGEANRGFTEDA